MSNRRYEKGARAERERVAWHYAQGALVALRAAGSHSPYDVVAVYDVHGWLVVQFEQLKSRKENAKLPLPACADGKVHSQLVLREHGGKWRVF